MARVLELFSGTGSIGKCCKELGWESISVDLESKFNPTHLCDIMDFNYKQYSPDYFDIVWASPPCTEYSHLQNTFLGRNKKGIIFTKEIWEDNMKEADKIVLKTLEIINYFKSEYYFIENPQTGKMKDREIMKDIPFYDVDYCKYSLWGYKKRTRIWTNKENWTALTCKNDCDNIIKINNQVLHKERMGTSKTIQDGDKIIRCNTAELRLKYKDYPNLQSNKNKAYGKGTTITDRYRIPPDLIYSLFID